MPISRRLCTPSCLITALLLASGCVSSQKTTQNAEVLTHTSSNNVLIALGDGGKADSDTLTVLQLPLVEPVTPFGQAKVANDFLLPSTCLAISPDGKYAFVTDGHEDWESPQTLTAIDLNDPLHPRIIGTMKVGSSPVACCVHPSGKVILVATKTPRKQIVAAGFDKNAFVGEPQGWPILGIDDEDTAAVSVAWHPSGDAFAVTTSSGEIVFFRFKRDTDGTLAIASWDAPVKVDGHLEGGTFSPDGRFFFLIDNIPPDTFEKESTLPSGNAVRSQAQCTHGRLICIQVAPLPGLAPAGTPAQKSSHRIACIQQTNVNPSHLAVSHDGTLLAVTMNSNDANSWHDCVVSLFKCGKDGTVGPAQVTPINALPGGLAFDLTDRVLAMSELQSNDPAALDGEVAFFNILHDSDGQPTLTQTKTFVGVGRGPHAIMFR